jgi:hypothetical protein
MSQGLWTQQISLGPRCIGWPAKRDLGAERCPHCRQDRRRNSRAGREVGSGTQVGGISNRRGDAMSKRHPNPRLAKIHRNYTVDEIANLFGVHKNSVRNWVKGGLPTSDDRRPMLILGRDLVAFLHARRVKNKRPCQPGEIYCMRCRAAPATGRRYGRVPAHHQPPRGT